ncbi:MAG: ABC transporter ATP-binding protein [Thermoanaerobaculia bacterium]
MSAERAREPPDEPLLSAIGLQKRYAVRRGLFGSATASLAALRGVDFEIAGGQTLGLVGESGSGKTTVGRIVARLTEPDSGSIRFGGQDWLALSGRELRRRRRDLQVVFQDPQTSLNPRMRAADQIGEPLRVQGLARGRALRERVRELLADVGLPPEAGARFPRELSGGQRQRVAIARALATGPRLVVCDEPVSALDVSIAAQIVNLLLDLRERAGLSYLFISHDLAVVSRIADRIAILYLGRIVEEGPAHQLTALPLHPYSAALVAAAPDPDPSGGRLRIPLGGEPPSAAEPPPGCPFHPRCPIARPQCGQERPELLEVAPGRRVACFFPGEMP